MADSVVRLGLNPIDGICYSKYTVSYQTGEERWGGPPGTGLLLSYDLVLRFNLTLQLVYCNNIWGQPTNKEDPFDPNNKGIVARMERGEVDWSPCTVTRTLRRAMAIDFSPTPYNMAELVMASRRAAAGFSGPKVIQIDSVLLPFDDETWTLLAGLFLLYGLLSAACKQIHNFRKVFIPTTIHVMTEWVDLFCPLLMKSIPSQRVGPRCWAPSRLIFFLWCFPTFVLSIFYGGELICYLSTMGVGNFIKSWDELFGLINSGKLQPIAFAGSWLKSEAESLFGKSVSAKIIWMATFESLFDTMYSSHGQQVWIDTITEIVITLNRYSIKPPQEVYLMGEGDGLGTSFDGFAFSKSRRDLQAKFNPWLMNYFETGHIWHWNRESEIQVAAYYLSRKPHVIGDGSGASGGGTAPLDFADFVGSYVCYALFLSMALISLSLEYIAPQLWDTNLSVASHQTNHSKIYDISRKLSSKPTQHHQSWPLESCRRAASDDLALTGSCFHQHRNSFYPVDLFKLKVNQLAKYNQVFVK